MADVMVIQGRQWSESDLDRIRNLMVAHPDWGRTRISVELCRQWDWHNQQGRLKDMAARTLLLKLERAGHLRLPRRRRKQSKARNLLGCFRDHPDGILAFMRNFAVPFDNNLSERDLRMMKLRQKISGTFRNFDALVGFCRIRGYVSTARKNGLNALEALRRVFAGDPCMPAVNTT